EHYQYLSLLTAQRALATAELAVVDVEELTTHGGSLRVYARPEAAAGEPAPAVKAVLEQEAAAGLHSLDGHRGFADAVATVKRDLLGVLLSARADGGTVAGYGSPGKGNTRINHCGMRTDLRARTV